MLTSDKRAGWGDPKLPWVLAQDAHLTPPGLTSSWSTSLFSFPTLHRRFSLTRSTHRREEHVNFFQWDCFTFISRHWLSDSFILFLRCSVCSLFSLTLTALHVIEGSLLRTVVRIRLTNIQRERIQTQQLIREAATVSGQKQETAQNLGTGKQEPWQLTGCKDYNQHQQDAYGPNKVGGLLGSQEWVRRSLL